MDREIGFGQLQIEQTGAPGELQGARWPADAPTRRQDMGDVLGAERLQSQAIVESAGNRLGAMHCGQRDDLAQMHDQARQQRRCGRQGIL